MVLSVKLSVSISCVVRSVLVEPVKVVVEILEDCMLLRKSSNAIEVNVEDIKVKVLNPAK